MASKLSRHAFTRFWDLHAWCGVIAGLVLYIMFVTGGITLFHTQLETWEEPFAQRSPSGRESLQGVLDRAFAAKGSFPDDLWHTTHGGVRCAVSGEVSSRRRAGSFQRGFLARDTDLGDSNL